MMQCLQRLKIRKVDGGQRPALQVGATITGMTGSGTLGLSDFTFEISDFETKSGACCSI